MTQRPDLTSPVRSRPDRSDTHPRDCRLCEALLALARSAERNEREARAALVGGRVPEGTAA
jgi:hypothetical protein